MFAPTLRGLIVTAKALPPRSGDSRKLNFCMCSRNSSVPIVSVIIPAYNATAFLEFAVSSVAAQTFRDFEILVVNDHSTDDTGILAETLLKKLDLRGRVINRPDNFRKGAGGARNAGAAAAKGRVVAFLDSDDAWVPEHLERAVDALQSPGAGIVAYCARGEAHHPATGKTFLIPHEGYPCRGVCDLRKVLLSGMIIPNQTLCVEVNAFHLAGGYAEDLACYEDWWLVLHLAGIGKFFVDHQIGCNVLVRESSLSHTTDSRGRAAMSSAMFRDALRFVRKNAGQGDLTRNEMKRLREFVADFVASQLFAAMRLRMTVEALMILGLIADESRHSPRIAARIVQKAFGLCCCLAWNRLLRAKA